MTVAASGRWPAVPGPVDRETFFAAQRRHRRARRRLLVVCAVLTFLGGIPLSLLLTPLIAIALLLAADLLNLVLPVPDLLEGSFERFGAWQDANEQRRAAGEAAAFSVPVVLALVALALLPGAIAQFVLWRRVHRLLRTAGTAGMLAEVGARAIRPGDLKELQLANAVEEMGIAAGIRPPQVRIVDLGPDGPVRNAAVFGRSPDEAVLVVGRALLDDVRRDQAQGVVAYLVASAANGDLEMATTTTSLLVTGSAVGHVLAAPFSRDSRAMVRGLVGPRFSRGGDHQGPDDESVRVHRLLVALSRDAADDSDDDSRAGTLALLVSWPLLATGLMYSIASFMMTLFFIGPFVGWFWRTRSALADADAVQLTRNPDGLAVAVASLAGSGSVRMASPLADLTTFVGPEVGGERFVDTQDRRASQAREAWRRQRWAERAGAIAGEVTAQREAARELSRATEGSHTAERIAGDLRPKPSKRLARLRRMGATTELPRPAPTSRAHPLRTAIGVAVFVVVLGPLMLMIGILALLLVVMTVFVALTIDLLVAALVALPLHYLLRALAEQLPW